MTARRGGGGLLAQCIAMWLLPRAEMLSRQKFRTGAAAADARVFGTHKAFGDLQIFASSRGGTVDFVRGHAGPLRKLFALLFWRWLSN